MNMKTCGLCVGTREIFGSNMTKISCPKCKGLGQIEIIEIIDNVKTDTLSDYLPTDGKTYNTEPLSPSGETYKKLQIILREDEAKHLEDVANNSSQKEMCINKKRPGRPKSLKNKDSEQQANNEEN